MSKLQSSIAKNIQTHSLKTEMFVRASFINNYNQSIHIMVIHSSFHTTSELYSKIDNSSNMYQKLYNCTDAENKKHPYQLYTAVKILPPKSTIYIVTDHLSVTKKI